MELPLPIQCREPATTHERLVRRKLRGTGSALRHLASFVIGVAMCRLAPAYMRSFVASTATARNGCGLTQRGRSALVGCRAEASTSFQELAESAEEDWSRLSADQLTVGQKMEGIVNSVYSYGCFVDVGADRDGLVHISQISNGFVASVADFVEPGQEVIVWVKGVDENGRLSLSMVEELVTEERDLTNALQPFADLPADTWLEGTVQSISDFGLHVALETPGGGPLVQGMVHISQIKDGFVEHPAEEATVGDAVKVRIRKVDSEAGRISLSMRQPAPENISTRPSPELAAAFADADPNAWLAGTVHHTMHFGVFVEIDTPDGTGRVQGLCHASEMREGFVDDPAAEVEVGQSVKVRVIGADAAAGRISFSMKPPSTEAPPA
eukprot:TRINITY_DN30898_c0_g1_i1.p1 TRINITY_DN30898_c0_g1~~TRINITY_DN30898_c0_g1_i1.p1  ORF type:complete len:382 (-),score=46.22 TRINITY_DN30898_c0_g1_i1:73-1218(-)